MTDEEREDWYWAAGDQTRAPAGDKFVIANGKEELWRRVRAEIDRDERPGGWDAVHQGRSRATIEDALDLVLRVGPMYRVNKNRLVLEAARIPVFAAFLRKQAHAGIGDYVSNGIAPEVPMTAEPYSEEIRQNLGRRVSSTLGIEEDWF